MFAFTDFWKIPKLQTCKKYFFSVLVSGTILVYETFFYEKNFYKKRMSLKNPKALRNCQENL